MLIKKKLGKLKITEREQMLGEELYTRGVKDLSRMRKRSRLLMERFNRPSKEKQLINLNKNFERMVRIYRSKYYLETPFYWNYGCHIHVGEIFYANFDTVTLDVAEVRLDFKIHALRHTQATLLLET